LKSILNTIVAKLLEQAATKQKGTIQMREKLSSKGRKV